MTIASDPIVSESDTTEREEPLERTTEQTPTIQDLQEDRALPLQNAMSAEMASYWDSILLPLIVIGGTIAFYFIIRYFIGKSADSLNLDRRQLKGIYSITKLILIVIAITIIIFHFSSLSGIAASAISVAAGTIIGFSSRNTISNAIAGILLLSSRPFKIGDRIKTEQSDELVGDVIEISLLYTKIKTVRNELVTIPNQALLQNQIVNYSGMDLLATSVEVSITYQNNRKVVESLLIDSAKNTEGIISENPAPYVQIKRFDNYAAIYEVRAYTNKANEYLRIQSEIRKKIYDLFQAHGLDLTVPQPQVNMGTENRELKEDSEKSHFE
jgi:small-conductance mechanosensitive channel